VVQPPFVDQHFPGGDRNLVGPAVEVLELLPGAMGEQTQGLQRLKSAFGERLCGPVASSLPPKPASNVGWSLGHGLEPVSLPYSVILHTAAVSSTSV
jgi:hypothetical protein